MVVKLITPDLAKHDFQFDRWITEYPVAESLDQTLARLIGYDPSAELFRFVAVDSSGRLVVNVGALKTKVIVTSQVMVFGATILLVSENDDREEIDIYNIGTDQIAIAGSSPVAAATSFIIPVGASYSTDKYNGAIYAISFGGSADVRILEVG